MMNNNKSIKGILAISIISVIAMYLIESTAMMAYFPKSAVKVVMFLALPLLYSLRDENIRIMDNFKIKSKKSLIGSFVLGAGVYLIILTAYFLLKDFIDLSKISKMLDKNVGVAKDNFLGVALYISLVNSLLEEFFFRGFIFLNLRSIWEKKFAYIVSAFVFAIYHVAIMGTWFSPLIFLIAMVGLFIGALIFNYLNEQSGNIYNSWLVHMMANLSINTVGLMMFGIIP